LRPLLEGIVVPVKLLGVVVVEGMGFPLASTLPSIPEGLVLGPLASVVPSDFLPFVPSANKGFPLASTPVTLPSVLVLGPLGLVPSVLSPVLPSVLEVPFDGVDVPSLLLPSLLVPSLLVPSLLVPLVIPSL
jgi:hypothetical protein